MAEITASMVKELRERTDAPMMDCKKALTEAEGDMTRGEEILRVRFGNKASKAAGRVAAEGTVGVSIAADGKSGAMIEVNSETDFCAKNEDFLAFTAELAKTVAASNAADIAAVSALAMRGATVEETRAQLVGKIGEKKSGLHVHFFIKCRLHLSGRGNFCSIIHYGFFNALTYGEHRE